MGFVYRQRDSLPIPGRLRLAMKEYLSVTAVASEDMSVGESHSEEKIDATEPPPDGWIYLQDEFGNYYYYNESAGTRSVLPFPGILYTSLHCPFLPADRLFLPFSPSH